MQVFNQQCGVFENVRCFLDSGSNRSFVTSRCAKLCGIQTVSRESLYVSAFGEKAKKLEMDLAKVDFYKNSDSLEEKVSVYAFIKDYIVPDLNSYELSPRQKQYIRNNNIRLADPAAAEAGKLTIDFLLGQDCCHQIANGGNLYLPGGSVLVPTWSNKYILAGPVDSNCNPNINFEPQRGPNYLVANASIEKFPFFVDFGMPRKLRRQISQTFACITNEDEMEIVDSFRTLEALGIGPLDYEISPVLEDFNKSTTYDGKRYTVRLPFKNPQIKKLSNNFFQAFTRLMSGYKRRLKPKFSEEKEKYHQSFQDDLDRGILEKVECLGTISEVREKLSQNPQYFNKLAMADGKPCVYLPHQCVYKQSTGKFRRVNDAKSRPHKNAYNLNDCLEKGPDLMQNILHILLGFRKNRYAVKADIEKAFPQVVIHPDDRDALRCLWYEGEHVWVYRFARLPFGLNCSPMILAGTLQKHMCDLNVDEQTRQNFLAALYVDDLIWSTDKLKLLLERKEFYTEFFARAGMNFRDWTTNHPEIRKLFGELEGKTPPVNDKVLGMCWDTDTDTISINSEKLKTVIGKKLLTKRHLWKLVPSIFDPLGLLSPYTLKGKEIISEACESCKGWDSGLPKSVIEKARSWAKEFDQIGDIKWDRFVGLENVKSVKLIGCCDASTRALGACVYLLSTDKTGKSCCNLIMSKTRINPKVKHSVPRLELLSALILVNIMNTVRIVYSEIPDEDIFYFTDSADVIFWLFSGHLSWRPFVANQVKKIRASSHIPNWRHIDTSENPADLPSRGTLVSELKNNSLWNHGPSFWLKNLDAGKSKLKGYDKHYKDLPITETCKAELKADMLKQLQHTECTVSSVMEITKNGNAISDEFFRLARSFSIVDNSLINSEKFIVGRPRIDKVITDFQKLKRPGYGYLMDVTDAVCEAATSFLKLIRRKKVNEVSAIEKLTLVSRKSEILWIQAVQQKYFSELFKLCENPKAKVSANSRSIFFKHLIFLDTELQVLRCTTRNEKSLADFSTVYPMLLPSMVRDVSGNWEMCEFTKMLVERVHVHIQHQGVPNTLARLRSEFWILQGRRFVQKNLRKCVACKKASGPFYSPAVPSSLPAFRVLKSRPFSGTGVDYLGPFLCKETNGPKYKGWYLLFTCGATRAIHLEAVKDRSTKEFIDASTRFMSMRGIPRSYISDCEGSFKKYAKELEIIFNSKRVREHLRKNRVSWNFYTEKSPNKGGFIERLNALVKKTIHKVLGHRKLDWTSFQTFAATTTSVINDRPMTYLYSDVNNEYKALSPSMLISGYNMGEMPHLNFAKPEDEEEKNVSEHYFEMERLRQSFWRIWQKMYISDLFERHVRQKQGQKELIVPKIGDVVLVKEENLPRREWRMGKVIDVEIRRGSVRQCWIQILSRSQAEIKKISRPPDHLVPLEVDSRLVPFNQDDLFPVEGDPRISVSKSDKLENSQKYSKKQLKKFMTAKILPPYRATKEFFGKDHVNVGPETDFVSKDLVKNRIGKLKRSVKFMVSGCVMVPGEGS